MAEEAKKDFNYEQAKVSIQWFVTTFGAGIIGFAAGKGWVDADLMTTLLNSPTVISALASIAMLVWGLVQRLKKNRVADVESMQGVKAVLTTHDEKGLELANKVPVSTVVPAGTPEAIELARAK